MSLSKSLLEQAVDAPINEIFGFGSKPKPYNSKSRTPQPASRSDVAENPVDHGVTGHVADMNHPLANVAKGLLLTFRHRPFIDLPEAVHYHNHYGYDATGAKINPTHLAAALLNDEHVGGPLPKWNTNQTHYLKSVQLHPEDGLVGTYANVDPPYGCFHVHFQHGQPAKRMPNNSY